MMMQREPMKRKRNTLKSSVASNSKLQQLALLWWRLGWSGLAGLFALCCLAAGWFASVGMGAQIRMAFVVFALLFFLLGFLQYFYTLSDFSQAHRQAERERWYRPPPHKGWIAFFLGLGLCCMVGLAALQIWRNL